MSYYYSDPKRANDPHAMPNVEVFQMYNSSDHCLGWFWHACFPGCLPDSDLFGPFDTEAEAVADAQSQNDDSE